jgi:hypothetical protein
MLVTLATSLVGFGVAIRAVMLDGNLWLTTGDYFCVVRHCDFLGIKFMYWNILTFFFSAMLSFGWFHKTILVLAIWWFGLHLYFFWKLFKKKDICMICVLHLLLFVILVVDNLQTLFRVPLDFKL